MFDEDFDLLGLDRTNHLPGSYGFNAYDPFAGWSGTSISNSESADRDHTLRNKYGFKNSLDLDSSLHVKPIGGPRISRGFGLDAKSLMKNWDDTFTQSGGDDAGGGDVDINPDNNMSINEKINTKWTPTNLSFTPRFNKLWKAYNLIKDKPGVQNDPRYHTLVKKLSRKMPRVAKNLEKSVTKSSQKRQEIAKILGQEANVSSDAEIIAKGRKEIANFIRNPHVTPEPVKEIKNDDKVISKEKGVDQDNPNGKTGINLNTRSIGSKLGTDISAALKNKKW
ncbi:MAG: hypothetical protein QGI18_05860 [Candidatus Marinimicrobia bacterium]|jgi:hypothetical protein|nr:hypothetical protein [Candidatus Neomarinimicrobiota bacterium]